MDTHLTDLTPLTDAELSALSEAVAAEIARRAAAITGTAPAAPAIPVRITETFAGYNSRRYSHPWIAVVTGWPVGGRPELRFGRFLGTDGEGGEVEVMALPGDVIRIGQKDQRRPNKSDSRWAIVQPDGDLDEISQAEARAAYKGQ